MLRLVLVATVTACRGADAHPGPADEVPSLPVASPTPTSTSTQREYVGHVRALRHAEVRSRLRGVIEAVAVDEGAPVSADQALFSIRAKELQQELSKAQAAARAADAELKLARIEQQNTRVLFERDIVSRAEMDLADARVEASSAKVAQAKAEQNQAELNLTYTKVRAPFDGIVNRIPNKVGSVVDEGDLLTTIADTREVHVYFNLSEREHIDYMGSDSEQQAREVSLRLADGSLYPEKGVIDAIENEVDRQTGNIALRARFPNPRGTLKHGSSAKVVVETWLDSVLLIPQKATFEVQGRLYVYVVDAEHRARAREVFPRVRSGDAFAIAEGLGPDDRYVVEGVQKLRDGALLRTESTD